MNLLQANIGQEYKFQDPVDKTGIGIANTSLNDGIGGLITAWLPNIYVIAGLILFIFILIGGLTIIMNAGSQEKIQQGQKTLMSAIIGFVILFASYWIIQIVQVVTGVPILKSGL